MKSTLKVDYTVNRNRHIPLIKIIRPPEIFNYSNFSHEDIDPRDSLINDLLKSPGHTKRNLFFKLGLHGNSDSPERPEVSTIEPILEDNLFYKFRWAILERMIHNTPIPELMMTGKVKEGSFDEDVYKKVTEFFDWLDKQETNIK